jgi:hypothetical protein
VAEFFLEGETFQAKFVEEIKTHILCSKHFSENCAVYEMVWKNMVEPERPHVTI